MDTVRLTASIFLASLALQTVGLATQIGGEQEVRIAEARQALDIGEYARAEKLALVVMQNAEKGEEPRSAWRIYAECRFRQGGYREAITFFRKAVRQNSDERVNAMMSVASLTLGDAGGDMFLGPLSMPKYLAGKAKVEVGSLPAIVGESVGSKSLLAYAWFALAVFDKGQQSLDAANAAEKALPSNIAITWMQACRLFELGKFKDAKAKFQIVAKSDFEKMAEDAKKRVADCDANLKKGTSKPGGDRQP